MSTMHMSGHPTILITWPRFDPEDAPTAGRIRAAGYEVRHAAKRGRRTPEELIDLLPDVVGAIVSTDPFTAEVFQASPDLRVVARTGVGLDTIDLDAASEAGVAVLSTPGANHDACADHTLALMLGVIRRLRENDAAVRREEWDRAGKFSGGELTRANVGLIGFGRIGQAVAKRLGGFDATIRVYDPEISNAAPQHLVSLDELIARSDIVSIHCPLTDATRNLIGEREFNLAKPGLILINTARGGIVDEQALIAAIRSGAVAGAGLDVFEVEPPDSSELLQMENVTVSPHIAGLSERSMATMLDQCIDGVLDNLGSLESPASKRSK
ncbi:MAG: phosphoglycerate dehydrogenase [Acidimicrobiia bacterium]